ncbi:MAG TPA: acyl-CoA dehydratase activase [Vicinamibacterales bacterium]
MAINIGLDIGAIGLKLAALGAPGDRPLLESLCAAHAEFRWVGAGARPLVVSHYVRIAGSPIQATYDLLQAFYETVPETRIEGIRVTGSGSRTIARLLGIYFENEFKAAAHMVARFYPDTRTVFEIGGESSRYLRLERGASGGPALIADYDRGGECAAGTGSFLDQQTSRLGYSVEEMSAVVRTATTAARIAGRCSVFAKSDMVHAQQQGCSPAEILRGLCRAVAQNFKSSVVKGRSVQTPVLFIGAVACNDGVVEALREAFDLDASQLVVPPLYAWCGAIGAAMLEAEETDKRSFGEIHRLHQHAGQQRPFDGTPLTLDNVVLLRDRVRRYAPAPGGQPIRGYLGIDVGSVSTNLVVVDETGEVVFDSYLRTSGRPVEAVQQGLTELERAWGPRLAIAGVGTTGSGRELVAEFVGADVVNDEITAHKTGAVHVSTTQGGPPVDTIFEIGGQDSKFIAIEGGVVVDFTMNEACAAGTGSFLEEQAEKLGIDIKDEFARLALSSPSPTKLGERCTVFMERDVTGWLHKAEPIPDLVAGLAYSIALNYLNRVVRGRRIGDVIYFQGGTAYNDAVAAAFAAILGKPITVPPYNGVMGAIGMALIARGWHRAGQGSTRFRGYDLTLLDRTTRDFVCRACSNECDIKEFTIDGQKSYWGDKCSDRYRRPAAAARLPVIDDLLEYRDQVLEEITGQSLKTPDSISPGPLTIGIPRTMATLERYPFWHAYFSAVGLRPVLSRPTDRAIAGQGIELALAQPCFPVQVAHGHVLSLFELGVDYVLVPNMLDNEAHEESTCVAHFCPWTQTLPYVLRSAPRLEAVGSRILAPSLHFQLGRESIKRSVAEMAQHLGIDRRVSDRAVDAAYAAQRQFQERLLDAGRRALDALDRAHAPGLVLVGRPYNIYDRNINCDIPRKLRRHYGANVIPLDFLVTGRESIDDLHANMYWTSGQRILESARLVASRPNLHIIYISNFKCGPDSYIKYFTRQAAGTPLLVLQFDGHGNDAGYLTRCEAYLDSKGILRCYPEPTQGGASAAETAPTR